jgi:HEAT repeat protein
MFMSNAIDAPTLLTMIRAARQAPTGLWPSDLVVAINDIDDPVVFAALAVRLAAEPENIRVVAARVLGRAGNPEALETLTPLLGDPSGAVRLAAVLAVEEYGAVDDMVPALAALIDGDPDPQVRGSAARCLGIVATPASDAALARALADPEPKVRAAAAATASRFGRLGQR